MSNITKFSGKITFYEDQIRINTTNGIDPTYTSDPGWDLTYIASNVSLKDDLKKYGSLKKAIQGLNQELSDLKISKTSLRMNTQDNGNASNEQMPLGHRQV